MNQTKEILLVMITIVLFVSACNPAETSRTHDPDLVGKTRSAITTSPEESEMFTPAPDQVDTQTPTPTISFTKEIENQKRIPTGEPVIVFKRSGGLAGISEEWRFYEDGLVTSLTGLIWQLDPQEVSQQVEELKAWGFFELESEYFPENTCCDRYLYSIIVKQDEQEHRVDTMDGLEEMPHSLWIVLQSMNTFINELRIDPDLTPQA